MNTKIINLWTKFGPILGSHFEARIRYNDRIRSKKYHIETIIWGPKNTTKSTVGSLKTPTNMTIGDHIKTQIQLVITPLLLCCPFQIEQSFSNCYWAPSHYKQCKPYKQHKTIFGGPAIMLFFLVYSQPIYQKVQAKARFGDQQETDEWLERSIHFCEKMKQGIQRCCRHLGASQDVE